MKTKLELSKILALDNLHGCKICITCNLLFAKFILDHSVSVFYIPGHILLDNVAVHIQGLLLGFNYMDHVVDRFVATI